MPTARGGLGVGVVNGVLYAIGGSSRNWPPPQGVLNTVEAYDPVANSWTTKAPMPTPRSVPGVGVVNGIIYAIGGGDASGPFNTVEAYDPVANSWTTKAPMPTPRSALGVGVVNGILYAIGGWDLHLGLTFDTVEAYDPVANTWTAKASMPSARSGLGVGVANGMLYAIGGYLSFFPYGGIALNAVEAYDPAANSWTAAVPMPSARTGFGVGVLGGIIYAIGGGSGGTPALNKVEAYDPVAGVWTIEAAMATPRYYLGVGTAGDAIYAVGGENGLLLSAVEAFVQLSVGGVAQQPDLPASVAGRGRLSYGTGATALAVVAAFGAAGWCVQRKRAA